MMAAMRPRSGRRAAVLVAVALVVVSCVAWWRSITPRTDRVWAPEHAVMPEVEFDGHLARIHNVRSFRWRSAEQFTRAYDDRVVDLDSIRTAWFIVTPFSRRFRGPAHTFVSFGFADSQYVAISVEARRQPGEHYAVLTGLFKRFEVIYVVGDERDLIGSRARFGGYDVYVYPIRASPERIRAVFVEMLHRANRLREHPEFYNTFTNNCTTNLLAHVDQVAPHLIPRGIKTVFPGYADEVAYNLGLIDDSVSLADARSRYRVNDRARAAGNAPDFSQQIRRAVPDADSGS